MYQILRSVDYDPIVPKKTTFLAQDINIKNINPTKINIAGSHDFKCRIHAPQAILIQARCKLVYKHRNIY
jgi:hypothetical protein